MALTKAQLTLAKNLIALLQAAVEEQETTTKKPASKGKGRQSKKKVEEEDDLLDDDGDLDLDEEELEDELEDLDEEELEDEDDMDLDEDGGLVEDEENDEKFNEIRKYLTAISKKTGKRTRAINILKKFNAKDVMALGVDDLDKCLALCKKTYKSLK